MRDRLARQLKNRLTSTGRIPFNATAAGRPISFPDCQIAAIPHAHGATMATRNVGDFEGCGVAVIEPRLLSTQRN